MTDFARLFYPLVAALITVAGLITIVVLLRLRAELPAEKPIARMLLGLVVWLVFAFTLAEAGLVVSALILVVDPDPTHSLPFRLVLGFVTQIVIAAVVFWSMWTVIRRNPARPRKP